MILACDSWSHRMDKDPLTPTELTLTLRVLVGHPIPYLTAWHDVLTLYSYRPSPSSSMMETENEGVELHPSVQLRTLVCGTQWKNEEEKQKQQPQKENHLDSFQPSSSSNGFESMMKHWLMYQTVIDDQWVDPWFLHLMLLWPTSTIRTTSTRSNLTSSPTTSSLSSSDRSIPPPTKLPHLQASIVDPSSSLQESMMRTRKRKRKENLYPSSSTPFSSSSFTPKKPLHVLRYYVFVTMLSFPKYRETYFIPAYASSTGISREVWTSMYLPSVLPTWSTYVSQDQLSRLFESAQAILCDSSLFPSPSPSTFTRNQLIQIYFQAYLSTFHVPWLIPCTPPSLVQATEPESPGSCFSVHPQIKKKRGPTVWQHIAHRWLMYLNSIRPTTTTTTTTPPWTTTHLLPSHQRWVQLIQLLGGGRGGHQGPPSATPPLTSKVGVLSKTYKRDMGRGVLHRVTQEEEEEVQEDDEEGYVFSSFQWKVFCVAWSLGWKYLKDPSIPWTHHDLFTLLTTLKFMEAQVEESENQGSLTKGIGGGGSSLSFHRMYEVLMARMLEIEE
ncbi:hypothetical protein HMI55_001598 [Coelomomyces lativittatus]|nr:hypothetical protein HMI56_002335 [Coelomomyces lativittatus]KAJ1505433.1 hypothetical protein HMI55_001598 [Coelomomyces lativittatus]